MMATMPEAWFRGWQKYYDVEPWGEERDDWRQMAYHVRWAAMLNGSNKELPKPVWPYFEPEEKQSPQEILEGCARFEDAIEPRPGGGYQWKVKPSGDDDRQTELPGRG